MTGVARRGDVFTITRQHWWVMDYAQSKVDGE